MCQEIEREGQFYLSQCKYFKFIDQMKARAFVTDPQNSKIKGLCYRIQKNDLGRYAVIIKSWEYNIYNEYYERPVLSFSISYDHKYPEIFKINSAKIFSCPVKMEGQAQTRFMEATALILKQIQGGAVIDVNHVLGIYRIKPPSLEYETVTIRQDNRFEGLQGNA